MAFEFKAQTVFSANDQISGAVDRARKNTEVAGGKMGKSLDGVTKKSNVLKSSFSDLGKIAAGVAIGNLIASGVTRAAGVVKKLVLSVDEFAQRADNARISAMKIGLSAEGWQKLSYAADGAGVSADKLQAGFNSLNKNLGSGGLVKFLGDTDKALLSQVKAAKSNTEIFNLMADAISKENDIAKRAALGASAFGKSWAELYPVLSQGAEGIRKVGEAIPNLISDRQISAAKLWNSTIGEMKKHIQGFVDVIRNAVIRHIGPLLLALKEWVENNRELIKQKINEYVQKAVVMFKKAVGIIQDLIEKVKKAVQFFREWGPVILAVGATVGVLWGIVSAVIAIKNAVIAAKAAFAIFNAVVLANPIVLIVTAIVAAVAALIAGFVVLANKVGGFKNALIVAGETIMKFLLTPINLVIDAIGGLMSAIAHIPGMNWANTAAASVQSFQDRMNILLTGSDSTITNSGPGYLADPYRNARAAYLAEHPETVGVEGDDGAEGKWEELVSKFNEMIVAQQGTTEAVLDLQDSGPNSPKSLRWGAMGQEDYWQIARMGV